MRKVVGRIGQGVLGMMFLFTFLFNFFAGIVGGIWLLCIGYWRIVLVGFLAALSMPWWWVIVSLPSLGLMALLVWFGEKNSKVGVGIVGVIGGLYDSFLIMGWLALVFSSALIVAWEHEGTLYPMLLFAYSVATSPLLYIASKESPDSTGTNLTIFIVVIGSIVTVVLGFFGVPLIYPLIILCVFMLLRTFLLAGLGVSMIPKGNTDYLSDTWMENMGGRIRAGMIRGFKTFEELRSRLGELQSDKARCKENVFVSLTLPSEKELLELGTDCKCEKCGNDVRVVDFDLNKSCGALMLRCVSCYEDYFLFITKEQTTSPDVCIFRMSPKLGSTQSLFAQFECPGCKQAFQPIGVDTTGYDIKTIVATHLSCSNCRECMNIVFWDRPHNYYEHSLKLGDCVKQVSPEAALVFYVSALENYLQKVFVWASSFNKYLVVRRHVSFQNLREANEVFKQFFALNLAQHAGGDWEVMLDAVRKRNMIVHNAGHDNKFNPISVDDGVAETVRETVSKFVDVTLRPEVRKRYID